MVRFHVFIPSRLGAMRFPGKALANIQGKPMIAAVVRASLQSNAQRVVVATDDLRIAQAAQEAGAETCMIQEPCHNGSERIAKAAAHLALAPETLLVNVQGDEPGMDPALINQVAEALSHDQRAVAASAYCPFDSLSDWQNPNQVKVLLDCHRRAMIFSRLPIPALSDPLQPAQALSVAFRHIGIYAYSYAYLKRYVSSAPTPVEKLESLEQLRILEHGDVMAMVRCERAPLGIDTQKDLDAYLASL